MNFISTYVVFFSTFLINLFFLIKLKTFTHKLNLIDYPINKLHKENTPKFGFFFSISVIANISLLLFNSNFENKNFIFIIYLFIFSIIGLLDDLYELSVNKRIFLSLIFVFIFFIINPNNFYVSNSFSYLLNFLLLVFFTLGFLHLVNITDGLNGLVPSLFLYSCLYYLFKGFYNLEYFFQILLIVSIISISVFIIPNFFGLCFLGNSGSYFIPIIISLLYMDLYSKQILEYSDILLIFLIPLIDGLRVTISRIFNRKSPFAGDFNHIHQMVRNSPFKIMFFYIITFMPSILNFFYKDYTLLILALFICLYLFFFFIVKKK